MRIHLWGTDFRRGNAEIRRKLYIAPEDREQKLKELLQFGFSDLVYLATCNRIEFYTTAKDPFCDTRRLWSKVLNHFGIDEEGYYAGYQLEGKSALRHIIRVASSLESLVVGEPQILGQLKEALRWSKENNVPVSPVLDRCFQVSFETAKKIRTQTSIAERPVSVATLGLQHFVAHEEACPLRRVVVVGRSPISLVVLQWFMQNRPNCPLVWVNRTLESLRSYPEAGPVELMPLADFMARPPEFSHLFTATASREPLFTSAFFDRLDASRRVIFDFAEPIDVVDPGESRPGITVIKLENLKEEAHQNAQLRASSVEQAETIVESAVRIYCLQQKEAPLLKDFNDVEPAFFAELNQALQTLKGEFPQETHAKLQRWAEALVKRNLHNSREHLRAVLRKVTEPADETATA